RQPIRFRREGLAWQIKSSSRKKPARQKTSAPPLVLATERSCRLKATCSISSNLRMLYQRGSTGRRYFFDRKLFTALASQKVETKPPSSKPFARPFGPSSGFGSPPIAIEMVSLSVRRY